MVRIVFVHAIHYRCFSSPSNNKYPFSTAITAPESERFEHLCGASGSHDHTPPSSSYPHDFTSDDGSEYEVANTDSSNSAIKSTTKTKTQIMSDSSHPYVSQYGDDPNYTQFHYEEHWEIEEREMIRKFMIDRNIEIIALVEGQDALTGE